MGLAEKRKCSASSDSRSSSADLRVTIDAKDLVALVRVMQHFESEAETEPVFRKGIRARN